MHPLWLVLVLLPVIGGAERFNCRGRILGAYYADAKSGCKAFHVCVRVAGGGIRDFRFFCPPGTLFHQEAQTCTDWGDDDPLACPADIYDGQFDLYKIGSGFDTKKLSSSGNRDEESEFGLQRADTGDRRLSQNNAASDLRAAHSSDFFSGQRDRGRDESAPTPQHNQVPQRTSAPQQALAPQQVPAPQQSPVPQQAPAQQTHHRQSFRRPTTRAQPATTQFTNPPPSPPPEPSSKPHYDSKRKLVRKRPVHVSTPPPTTTFSQNTQPSTNYPEQPQQNFNRRNLPQNRQTLPPVNVPPQFKEYKDEYVEVSRVTPKPNKFFQSNSPPAPFSQSSPAPNFNNKKEGLVELYNYDTQSTPGFNTQNENGPFKVRNSFSVADVPKELDYFRPRNPNVNTNNVRVSPTTLDYNTRSTTTTPEFLNFNSVSYEPEKNNYIPYSKQNYFNNPSTTTPQTTAYTTTPRSDPPPNLNTVAYNTNIGFNTQQSNYAENDEDDGQYRPPQGEDDGQYRPELYERERELLSGAHSLNIAASGNRLPEDQKPRGKTQSPFKPVSQTAAPRPFRPASTPSSPPSTQRLPEQTFPTTFRPQTQPQTQRTFDYYQTYTTTSRPNDVPVPPVSINTFDVGTNAPVRLTSTSAPRNVEPRVPNRVSTLPPSTAVPSTPPHPSTRQPFFANPPRNKEDASYDYAYYDSDPGFSEYEHIEEFGRTKKKA